jgi:hypothetical protein
MSRCATAALLLITVITGCTTSATGTASGVTDATHNAARTNGDTPVYPDAPREITPRWWLAPDVAEAPDSGDPEERAAAQVLQSYFGSDSAKAMAPVSIGPARVFAEFMIVMEAISGHHPMEEMISRRVPRIVDRQRLHDLLIDGEITEDRSTGSGRANRTTFDQFVVRAGSDGQLRMVDFRRDGRWISELVATGDDVEFVGTGNGTVRIVAVMRSTLGRYMVAGVIAGIAAERWSLHDVRLESIDGEQKASESFSEVGASDSADSAPFLITFDDGGLADHGARLILPPLDTMSQQDLVFEIPPLGVPRDGGDVSGG